MKTTFYFNFDSTKLLETQRLLINRFFSSLFINKLVIWKKRVGNQNLNRKVVLIVLIQTPTPVFHYDSKIICLKMKFNGLN